jgi:hypothetical protein
VDTFGHRKQWLLNTTPFQGVFLINYCGFCLLSKMCENARMNKRNSENKRPFTKKSFGSKPTSYGKPVSSGGAGARRPSPNTMRPFAPKKGASAPSRAVPPKVTVPSPTPTNQHFRAAAAAKRQQAFERQGSAPKKPAPEKKFPSRVEQKFSPRIGASAAYKGGAKKPVSVAYKGAGKPVASAPYRPEKAPFVRQSTSSRSGLSKPRPDLRLPGKLLRTTTKSRHIGQEIQLGHGCSFWLAR